MKKLSIWLLSIVTLLLGLASCEINEEFDRCPELKFTFSKLDSIVHSEKVNDTLPTDTVPNDSLVGGYYKFIADFPDIEETAYEWFVNDSLVDSELILDDRDNMYVGFFGPGTYKVCIFSETPDCPEGISFCETLVVRESNPACPELRFSTRTDTLSSGEVKYKFIADFKGIEEISYGWFINGDLVEDSAPDEINYLRWDFEEAGVYEVCIKTETPNCPEGASYCEEVIVREGIVCPDLFFEYEQDGDNIAYYFYPGAFEGIDEVTLEWFVNEEYVGSSPEFPHNNPFYYQFDGAGRYEVCVMVETPDCPNGISFCKVIEIGDPTQE